MRRSMIVVLNKRMLYLLRTARTVIKDSFLEEFNKKKKEKAFNVLSFTIGSSANTVEQFSDKVVRVNDFEDEGSYAAFEI